MLQIIEAKNFENIRLNKIFSTTILIFEITN